MKTVSLLLLCTLACACNRDDTEQGRVAAYQTGTHPLIETSAIIRSYGSHAIRIDDGSIRFRVYRIDDGIETLEHDFVLSANKHPMAWVTPAIWKGEARFEFGAYEFGEASKSTPLWITTFDLPAVIGGGPISIRTGPTREEELLHYTLLEDADVSLIDGNTRSRELMRQASKEKKVAFFLVTVAPK